MKSSVADADMIAAVGVSQSPVKMEKMHLNTSGLRVLVAIASYGEKNIGFLKGIIASYKKMQMEVKVVVLSESQKNLGEDVQVIVGLPTKDPWSLPFAHKQVFAENVDRYDLFIYSEDDIEVTEKTVTAFLRLSEVLEPDEIAGYVRYETSDTGARVLTDVHGSFHWSSDSVRRRGSYTVAELTNEHAGFYILTQDQLRRAIKSGGFLRAPYQGRYGIPESAATDPYTSCGFRKVVCISEFDDFLIRHMSNLYVHKHGLGLESCREQIQSLFRVLAGELQPASLCAVEPKVLQRDWSKSYYEPLSEEIVRLASESSKTGSILSVGCGTGATESVLCKNGWKVTAFPLDSVIGSIIAAKGINVLYGAMDECFDKLRGKKFNTVIISNLLHLQRCPAELIEKCANVLEPGGNLIVAGPNFEKLPVLIKKNIGISDFPKIKNFEASGVNAFSVLRLKKWIRNSGLHVNHLEWTSVQNNGSSTVVGGLRGVIQSVSRQLCRNGRGRFTADNWVVRGQKR